MGHYQLGCEVMGRGVDVYQLIRSFSERNKLSKVDYKTFAQAIQRQARLSDQSEPVYRDLSLNPDIVLVPRLFLLSKEKKLVLQTVGNEISFIVMPEYFEEAFLEEYHRMDESLELPFPDEDTLQVPVPEDWIQAVSIETDLGTVSEEKGKRSVPLFRIVFPDGVRPLVIPSAYVPEKLLEYAVQKLRQYLRKGANKEYMYNKLVNAFPGKEGQLKDAMGLVLTRPFDAVKGIVRSDSDFTYPFWAYFVSAIKKDLDKKKDKTPEDWSYFQSAMLCEFYANHYKTKAQRVQDLEAAIKALDAGIRKPPYHFSMDDILAFRDAKGMPMLGKFSHDELEAKVREKCTKADDGALPELIVVSTSGRRAFVAKDRALLLAVKQISEARPSMRTRFIEQWKRLLEDFRSCAAMETNEAFLAELSAQVESRFPILDALIRDRLLPIVRDEAAARGELPPDVARLFYKDDLIPLDELFDLSRKSLLVDAKMLMPFWYSVPILSSLARLVHRLTTSRAEKAAARAQAARLALEETETKDKATKSPRGLTSKERRAEFEAAATRIAKELLPKDYGLDEYLNELEGRWNSLLSPEAKKNLTYDVESLARDYLRGVLRSMGTSTFTTERLKNLGSSLADTPTLLKIKNHQALELYIQLYMVKVLGARIDAS
jgi:hypothetical protein